MSSASFFMALPPTQVRNSARINYFNCIKTNNSFGSVAKKKKKGKKLEKNKRGGGRK